MKTDRDNVHPQSGWHVDISRVKKTIKHDHIYHVSTNWNGRYSPHRSLFWLSHNPLEGSCQGHPWQGSSIVERGEKVQLYIEDPCPWPFLSFLIYSWRLVQEMVLALHQDSGSKRSRAILTVQVWQLTSELIKAFVSWAWASFLSLLLSS